MAVSPSDRKWLRSPNERGGTLAHSDLPPPSGPSDDDNGLVPALRARDEEAFERLLARHNAAMLRLALNFVRSREEAEEVVQDTWLAVLTGLSRFQDRSSLKTWIFRILVNRARTRARREARTLPFSSLQPRADDSTTEADGAEPEWLMRSLTGPPPAWHGAALQSPSPDDHVLAAELREMIDDAIGRLPERQQEVITLLDLQGWTTDEVCSRLAISGSNQRVLLHRARVRVRDTLAGYV